MHLIHTLFISKLRPPDKAIVLLLTNMENYKQYVLLRLQFVDNIYHNKSPWSQLCTMIIIFLFSYQT